MYCQEIPIPIDYSIIASTQGDLNQDGIDELVVAYNTKPEKKENRESIPRTLTIYKKVYAKWEMWKSSMQVLLGSEDGGMMGDPFGAIEIKNGVLWVSQNGGSSWKWGFTDKYRYQEDDFYLIGYKSNSGKPCEYWYNIDFNLSTGKLIVSKEYERCENGGDQEVYKRENEEFFKKDIRITFEKRNDRAIQFRSPKYKHTIYISTND
ncbi:MAG: hypothetical protein RL607_426 [Bacteroidota bacterium]